MMLSEILGAPSKRNSFPFVIAAAALLLGACTAPDAARKAPLKPSGGIMTIDEEMYDAPAFAQEICERMGYAGAVLISRDAAAKKSAFQCGN